MAAQAHDSPACPECGAPVRDPRTIECAYCGRPLRQPYEGDPLGKWVAELNDCFIARVTSPRDGWIAGALFAVGPLFGVVATAVGASVAVAVALGLGAFGLTCGVEETVHRRLIIARRRRIFEAEFLPKLEAFREKNGVAGWRFAVLVGETFTKKQLLRFELLPSLRRRR